MEQYAAVEKDEVGHAFETAWMDLTVIILAK